MSGSGKGSRWRNREEPIVVERSLCLRRQYVNYNNGSLLVPAKRRLLVSSGSAGRRCTNICEGYRVTQIVMKRGPVSVVIYKLPQSEVIFSSQYMSPIKTS